MNVEYTNRAVADLRKVSTDSRESFGDAVAESLERRIREVVDHIAANPEAAPSVSGQPGLRMFPLIRYPYKIFYRVLEGRIRILHIRHTSRRPWVGSP
jgi:plasmid stabilization system protein ParE